MIVAQDGSGDFFSIQAAIDYLFEKNITHHTLTIKNGVYFEKINLTIPHLHLIGEDPKYTIIEYNDYALKPFNKTECYKTFRSYTIFIGASHLTFENITFKNSAGSGDTNGQAISAYVDGDKVAFFNCHFLGHQDTLFTGPLPVAPKIPNSFTGPKEHDERINGRQYYENCYIQGDIDFIFGSATCYFNRCTIVSNDCQKAINGYITAASTPANQTYGYVFYDCELKSTALANTVYLGRPWREYAHVAFINCQMGSHINKEGWHDWGQPNTHITSTFVEIDNTGDGASLTQRVTYLKTPTLDYSISSVLNGWNPQCKTSAR